MKLKERFVVFIFVVIFWFVVYFFRGFFVIVLVSLLFSFQDK